MPYISNNISKLLNTNQKEDLKTELAKILKEEANKGEAYLMVEVTDRKTIFFGGEEGEFAFILIRHLGTFDITQKENITKKICGFYEDSLGIPRNAVYINFQEVAREDWGFNSKTFA